jgi:hypothetical protein
MEARARTIAHGVLRAAGQKWTAGLTTVAAGAGALSGSWTAVALSAAAYALAVAATLGSPSHWRRVGLEIGCRPIRLPSPEAFASSDARRVRNALFLAQQRRLEALELWEGRLPERLKDALAGVAASEERVLLCLRRADMLERHIVKRSAISYEAEINGPPPPEETPRSLAEAAYLTEIRVREEEAKLLRRLDDLRREFLARSRSTLAMLEMIPILLVRLEVATLEDGLSLDGAEDIVEALRRELRASEVAATETVAFLELEPSASRSA